MANDTINQVSFVVHISSGETCPDVDPPTADIMEPSPTLRFTITYPLTNPAPISVTHEDGRGWTQIEFVEQIRQSYVAIYAAERHPGYVRGLANRAKSKGPYGIVGHDIEDLILEGAERSPDGSWQIWVGS